MQFSTGKQGITLEIRTLFQVENFLTEKKINIIPKLLDPSLLLKSKKFLKIDMKFIK